MLGAEDVRGALDELGQHLVGIQPAGHVAAGSHHQLGASRAFLEVGQSRAELYTLGAIAGITGRLGVAAGSALRGGRGEEALQLRAPVAAVATAVDAQALEDATLGPGAQRVDVNAQQMSGFADAEQVTR